ncbi:hypothetical protein TNCV_1929841 [Trichonephila clavipes]|nr:hypothetical protein TNCV_1929841 [Trichonephila clavipes]
MEAKTKVYRVHSIARDMQHRGELRNVLVHTSVREPHILVCKGQYIILCSHSRSSALQLWLFPQLEESEPDYFVGQQDGAPHHWHLSLSSDLFSVCGLAIHQNDHQARRRFVEWARNEIAVVPDFHKRILFSDEAHFWLNGYVNKQNCRIWSEANPQVYIETLLHPEKLTVWCALWAGGILLQKR